MQLYLMKEKEKKLPVKFVPGTTAWPSGKNEEKTTIT